MIYFYRLVVFVKKRILSNFKNKFVTVSETKQIWKNKDILLLLKCLHYLPSIRIHNRYKMGILQTHSV